MDSPRFILLSLSVIGFLCSIFVVSCSREEPYTGPVFTDVADRAGVSNENFGRMAIWGDFDGDGLEDLYVAIDQRFAMRGDFLFWNQGDGTFREGSQAAGIVGKRRSFCAAAADYDNDGDIDLFIANLVGHNVLYRNNADGTFTDLSGEIDLGSESCGAAWGDYDSDGWVDLFVTNSNPDPNALYRNRGDGSFEEVSAAAGFSDPHVAYGVAWSDYDNDGDLDLFVSGKGPDRLYRNEGDGTFVDVAGESGIHENGVGRGVAWADYDADGDYDLYLGNLEGANALFRNEGDGTFVDVTKSAGVADDGWTEGVSWADYDNDGWLDLFIARIGGHGKSGETDRLFRNRGDGTFRDVSEEAGVAGMAVLNYGCPWADFDNDGDLDLYVTSGKKSMAAKAVVHLYRNEGSDNNWLRLRLVGKKSNRLGIGARVAVSTAAKTQIAQVTGGSGYLSQGSPILHFGLGREMAAAIRIEWPSGTIQEIPDIEANQVIVIEEE
jgi:hypothetical protein